MFSKLKKILKWLLWLVIVTIILFGIYRREYLSQAIPVYMQYLEQRSKWEKVNTGTYVLRYSDTCLLSAYYFIRSNRVVYLLRDGNPFNGKYLIKSEWIKRYIRGGFCSGFRDVNDILIEKRFDEVLSVLWLKLWDKTIFEQKGLHYPVEIGYDKRYGYPRGIVVKGGGYEGCILIDDGKPYLKFYNSIQLLSQKENIFSDENIQFTLDKLREKHDKEKHNIHFKQVNMVGGEEMKSFLIQETGY